MSKMNGVNQIVFKTLIGVLFALGIFDILYSFTGAYALFGLLYPAAHVLLTIVMFLSLSFIWYRERWALFLLSGVILAGLLLDLSVGNFQVLRLLLFLPLIVFIFLWKRQ